MAIDQHLPIGHEIRDAAAAQTQTIGQIGIQPIVRFFVDSETVNFR